MLLLITFLALTATIAPATAQTPFSLLYSLTNPGTNGQFPAQGTRVAIGANFAVAAAITGYGSGGSQAVTVYDPTNGVVRYTLLNPGQPSNFGSCLAVSGTRVVVGDQDAHPTYNEGCVYVYDLASVKPTTPVLTLFTPQSPHVLWSVAASGNYVAAGSPFYVAVYDVTSATPSTPVVIIPTRYEGDSLAISGTRVVVGAQGSIYPPQNTNAGAVYVYDIATSTPTIPVLTLHSPTPAPEDFFGVSVAISGNRLVVGMDRAGTNVAGTMGGSAYVYDIGSSTPSVPVATLNNPNSSWGDYFGHSVGISGTRVIVGAWGDGTGAKNAGSAYVYELSSPTPTTPVATLNNPTPAADDRFAQTVAIAGARVIIGAPGDDSLTIDGGSAYLYDAAGTQPAIPVARLDPGPAPASSVRWLGFGESVAISGTRLIVGAPPAIYDISGDAPLVPIVTPYNPGVDGFGSSVAISGQRAVVAAYSGRTPGSVYVYDSNSTTPSVAVATLNGSSGEGFGSSVGISGTRVAVGAPDAGRAYVYDLASSPATQPAFALNNPGTAPRFGQAVAISGARLVVGASSLGYTNSAAYVYDLTTTPPGVLRLIDPAPSSAEMFGSSVAISGTRVVVGAYMVNWGSSTPGKAHIYNLTSDTPAVAVLTLTRPTAGFGHSVAISGTRVVACSLWASFEDGTGTAFVYDIAGETPAEPVATLANPVARLGNPIWPRLDSFGWSVAVDGTTVVVGSAEPPANGAAFVFGPRPRLAIAPASTNSATISWSPENSPEFFLQSANNLSPSNWINAPSGATHPVSISITNGGGFYRLFSP